MASCLFEITTLNYASFDDFNMLLKSYAIGKKNSKTQPSLNLISLNISPQ